MKACITASYIIIIINAFNNKFAIIITAIQLQGVPKKRSLVFKGSKRP